MKASIIILAWNGKPYLEACLDAVQVLDYPDFEILVVDNASTDGSADWVATHYPLVRVIRNASNLGFAAGNNVGLTAASGEVFVLLNQDTVVHPGWLSALVEGLQIHTGSGVVGSKILDMDGRTLQHAGGYIQRPLALGLHYGYGEVDNGQWDMAQKVEFVTGAALAFKREVYEKIGGLDEGFYPGYYEDVDFCYRAREVGYSVWYVPQSQLLHHESASMRFDVVRGHRSYYRNRLRFVFKHYAIAEMVDEYFPLETARIAHISLDELRALTSSILDGIFLWAEMAHHRRPLPTKEESVGVSTALHRLYDTVIQSLITREPEHVSITASLPLVDDLTSLSHLWHVTPQPFASRKPVIGPLIVALRNLVNNLACRWYVQPLLEQQVTFNVSVVRLLTTLLQYHKQQTSDQLQYHIQQISDQAQHHLQLVEQMAAMQQQVLLLSSRASHLEEKLNE